MNALHFIWSVVSVIVFVFLWKLSVNAMELLIRDLYSQV